jgi:glycosyltransferase involved in cell wall biosynthesis
VSGSPDISVIMPCYNRAHDLIRTLQAFDRQRGSRSFELIAIDDCSTDRTQEVLRSYQSGLFELKVLRQEVNQGPAAARNRGLEQAVAPLVLFVGDDILPDPYLVAAHLAAHRFYPQPEVGILGQVVWADDLPVNTVMQHIQGVGAQQFSYYYLQDNQAYDFRHFYTANVSVKRDFLTSDGRLFDTSMRFYEDGELSYRLTRRGFRIIYSKLPVGYHYHYYSARTFADRQFRAGLGACLFVNKHPQVRPLITGKTWKLKARIWNLQALRRNLPPDIARHLEYSALQNLGEYEWGYHPRLDTFYMAAFSYFFIKGLIAGTFGETATARKMVDYLASRRLSPLVAAQDRPQ